MKLTEEEMLKLVHNLETKKRDPHLYLQLPPDQRRKWENHRQKQIRPQQRAWRIAKAKARGTFKFMRDGTRTPKALALKSFRVVFLYAVSKSMAPGVENPAEVFRSILQARLDQIQESLRLTKEKES